MSAVPELVDIHCHLIPGIDDGPKSLDQALRMARIAVADGITTIVATPHQLGAYAHNTGAVVSARVEQLRSALRERGIPLRVLPGGDVRIDSDLVVRIRSGQALTLADRGRHVLLELPHELYFPIENVLERLHAAGMIGILSHPERNQGIQKNPRVLRPLIDRGCLMQVTAGSLVGTFGAPSRQLSEWMLERSLVHFVATDAHSPTSRRPLLRRAFERVEQLVGADSARQLCCSNPRHVVAGEDVVVPSDSGRPRKMGRWLPWRKSA